LLTEGNNEVSRNVNALSDKDIVNKAIDTVQEQTSVEANNDKIDNNFSKNNIENENVDENAIITENISNIKII